MIVLCGICLGLAVFAWHRVYRLRALLIEKTQLAEALTERCEQHRRDTQSLADSVSRLQVEREETCHNLRTPLNSIMAGFQLVQRQTSDIRAIRHADMGLKAVDQMLTLIDETPRLHKQAPLVPVPSNAAPARRSRMPAE